MAPRAIPKGAGLRRVANYRYIVQGLRVRDGREWPIWAADDLKELGELRLRKIDGRSVEIDGEEWKVLTIVDRRATLAPFLDSYDEEASSGAV